MEPTLVVIGREPCDTSNGPLAVGAVGRLPVVEAIQLTQSQKVTLADWHAQQGAGPLPSTLDRMLTAVEAMVEVVKVAPLKARRRYRRRDLRAEK